MAVAAALAFLTGSLWLPALGYALAHEDGPAKADIIVVLGGDYTGQRILKAADLIRRGYAPAALVSGPGGFYGRYESDFSIPFAVERGYPEQWFIPLRRNVQSTSEEAAAVLAELRRRGVRSFLLVTSDYHTARAGRICRAVERSAGGGPAFRVVGAPDQTFQLGSWWREREGRKTVFMEWCKTLTGPLGL